MAAKKIVMHVVNMNPDKHGVIEMQLLEMAEQLSHDGWQQIVIFNNEIQPWMQQWADRVGGIVFTVKDMVNTGTDQIASLIKEHKPDIIHVHFVTQAKLYKVLRNSGCKNIVMTIHSYRTPKKLECLRRISRFMSTLFVKRFIAISQYVYNETLKDYLATRQRVTMIYNGINTQYYKPRVDKLELRQSLFGAGAEAFVIAIISHLAPGKRLSMLINCMPMVVAHNPNALLVIAGGGVEKDNLHNLINELKLQNHVKMITSDIRTELIYAAADISCLPSEGEGLAGSAQEAMSCGLPFVCTPNGGISETIEPEISGIYVTNQTPEGLAEAIIRLMGNDELRIQMGQAARKRVEDVFDVRETARKTIAVYKELISE